MQRYMEKYEAAEVWYLTAVVEALLVGGVLNRVYAWIIIKIDPNNNSIDLCSITHLYNKNIFYLYPPTA